MTITLVTSLLSFLTYSLSSLTALYRFILANLVSSATIHSSDVTYLYVMKWLADHKISTDCRLFCVTSRKNPQSYAVRRYSSYTPYGDGSRNQQDDEDEDGEGCEDDRLGPKLKYTPAPGKLLVCIPAYLIFGICNWSGFLSSAPSNRHSFSALNTETRARTLLLTNLVPSRRVARADCDL